MARKQNLNGRLFHFVDELVGQGLTLELARREFERQFVIATLRRHDGNVTCSAKSMGVHRNTLRNKLDVLRITKRDIDPKPKRRPAR